MFLYTLGLYNGMLKCWTCLSKTDILIYRFPDFSFSTRRSAVSSHTQHPVSVQSSDGRGVPTGIASFPAGHTCSPILSFSPAHVWSLPVQPACPWLCADIQSSVSGIAGVHVAVCGARCPVAWHVSIHHDGCRHQDPGFCGHHHRHRSSAALSSPAVSATTSAAGQCSVMPQLFYDCEDEPMFQIWQHLLHHMILVRMDQ